MKNGKCSDCNAIINEVKTNGTAYSLCARCRETRKQRQDKQKQKRTENGICLVCLKPKDNTSVHCTNCKQVAQKNRVSRRERFRAEGKCYICGCERQNTSITRCYECIMKTHAKNSCGLVFLPELAAKLVFQNNRCVYSGRILELGINASVDHKIPKFKGGTDDISNLQWVDANVNVSKNCLGEEEFFRLIQDIATTLKLLPSDSPDEPGQKSWVHGNKSLMTGRRKSKKRVH